MTIIKKIGTFGIIWNSNIIIVDLHERYLFFFKAALF